MNKEHLKLVCHELQLGEPNDKTTSVNGSRGGSFVWRVNTNKAVFAIKQLAPEIDLTKDSIIAKYELSETIANRFARLGVPAISAIEQSGKHLIIIDKTGYLAYPWIDGRIGQSEIIEIHALRVAEEIAKLHCINMIVPEIGIARVDQHSRAAIEEAIRFTSSFDNSSLLDKLNTLLAMYDHYLEIIPQLLEQTVVTHGDLDQLNIIWDAADQPNIIDWESVRKLNPTREIVRACQVWSGAVTEKLSLQLYLKMLRTYIAADGMLNKNHINAALYSAVGSMVNWIIYNANIAGSSEDNIKKKIAIDAVNKTVTSMIQYQTLIPILLKASLEI